ncbi:DNA helicase [Neoasaia chiangmaiensis NBRC 101099]|uniref:ATP-dependent helicase HrpB n=1 Tax=Neoasaia chiangmaiensis TaxID=320497 RepID=A0A1U9KP96_9PROT|nr:ATP-dependent helicase HrpB [Neoasaia chiangmaiensis]AQS87641.1 ATP-dependent helicase HrpB [Neoasaia chiangmaiensis]GBR42014.1 DNA helicase [Neoasaia chiangmaiensis NBRC 101099]GEN14212.1 ATP-dependent helicase HrpB [Neoasaia chiangmaiensis]
MNATPASTSVFVLPDLPVTAALPELERALASGRNAVLVAPPGAGKTTLAPLYLLQAPWRTDGRIVVVEPRRVAVRSAAHRMASLLGEETGDTVGFRTRTDSAVSASTRIEVVTEGLLLRRLLTDPLLDGVAAILFDEVHERSLDLDTALAFALDLQRSFRPELRLVAMSATTDGRAFASLLDGELIESEGRQYPIDIRHAKRDIAAPRELADTMARAVREAFETEQGDILAFLPGLAEIRRAERALADLPALVLPLHGELATTEQDRALRPAAQRKIVLATSIAETSLTVPGVRVVVDGGFHRTPRFDAGSGLSRLETRRISRATATQRAGRAGREAPGIAIRLWTEATGRAMALQDPPEILNGDLGGHRLDVAAWRAAMGTPPDALPLLDTPPQGAVQAADALLRDLGALDGAGHITTTGQAMAVLGAQPRLAAMLCAARTAAEQATAACLAALLEERDPLRPRPAPGQRAITPPADIRARLALIAGDDHAPDADRASLARIRQSAQRYQRRLRLSGRLAPDPNAAAALIAAGFPDRVAQSRGEPGRYRLAGGGSGRVAANDPLARHTLLAAAALHVRTATDITLAAPLDPENLPRALIDRTTEQVETTLDSTTGSIVARKRLRLGALVLRDRNVTLAPEEAATLLLAQIRGDITGTLDWTDAARQFQARLLLARQHLDPDIPDCGDERLAATVDDWLAPYLSGITRLTQVKALDLLSILRARVPYDTLMQIDRTLPPALDTPGGRLSIDYTAVTPTVSARAQAFYGMRETPRLAHGKVPIQFSLLSPAGRPQAITPDIAAFWQTGWPDMRRDMRGRYPRHDWPENPADATPPRPRGAR